MSGESATFSVAGWDEQELEGSAGTAKVTRATYRQEFRGPLEANASSAVFIAYREDGRAEYAGFDRVTGHVLGREGSFVQRVSGTYGPDGLRARAVIVEGCGTGGLATLRGEASIAAPPGETGTVEFQFTVA